MQHKLIVLFIAFLASYQGIAQTNGNSPYSRFGIGDIVDENFMHTRAMGSIGSSYSDRYHINIVNPASYANLSVTAFDLGIKAERSTLATKDITSSSWNGNLEYISLAFPLFNPLNELLDQEKRPYKLGMAFTLMPNSAVGYNIISEEVDEKLGDIVRGYRGDGGSYKFLWGNGIKYKDFSFGINLGYLFGKISYERNIDFLDFPSPYQNRFTSSYSLNGFTWGIGAMYSKTLNQKALENKTAKTAKSISAGVRLKPAANFNTSLTSSDFGIQNTGFGIAYTDTLSFFQDSIGSGKMPLELGFGLSYYGGEKFMIGADFSIANWSKYQNDADATKDENPLSNTFSVSFGGYYRPNYKSYKQYFKRVYYRYGAYYKTDPRTIDGNRLKDMGVTFGMGLPFIYQRKISHLNLGFGYGKRGNGTPITESYYSISLGFTFNDDEWFVKRKYN